jgi:transketolase
VPYTLDDQKRINAIRALSIDAVQKANSGHPGLPLGAAPMAYVLWSRHLRFNAGDPHWSNRDRFVLSAGHGSALLYSLIYLTGMGLDLADLEQFRQLHSRTPGHPEVHHTPGVEVTTGPLGQGVANAVGLAMAEAHLAAMYNRPGKTIVDHHTYCLCGDGDLMEGVASEAASLAGHLQLGKLIMLYDDNLISLAARTDVTFTEDRCSRFAAYGWHTQLVQSDEGNDVAAIDAAITAAKADPRPSFIAVRTEIGFGSPRAGTFQAHGEPLGVDNVRKTKEVLNWPTEPAFFVPDDILAWWRDVGAKGASLQAHVAKRIRRLEIGGARTRRAVRARAGRHVARAHQLAGLHARERRGRDARRGRRRAQRDRRPTYPNSSADRPISIRRPRPISRASAIFSRATTRAATCTSACANTRWARSPTG